MLCAVALAVGGAAVASAPASANPGTSGYEEGFHTTLGSPLSDVAVDSYTAQVFAGRAGGVDILDENSGATRGSIPLPTALNPLLDADSTRALIWALDPQGHKLSRIDERSNTVTGSVTIAGDLRDLAVDHATGKVFVTTGANGTVVPVDEVSLAVGTAITVGGTASRIGVDPAAGQLYIVNAAGATLSVVDEATSTVLGTPTSVPAGIVAIAVDPAHHRAYLGSSQVSSVRPPRST